MSIRTYWHPLGGVDKNLLAPPKNYHVNAGVGAFQLILEYQMVSVGGQILTKDKRPPSLCRQCTAVVFLGLTIIPAVTAMAATAFQDLPNAHLSAAAPYFQPHLQEIHFPPHLQVLSAML